jgi:hypothetical protein
VISGNVGAGITLADAATTGNAIQGNAIGTQSDGLTALANTSYGVLVTGAITNTVGGTATGAANVIASNGAAGVYVETGNGIAILSNAIFSNTGLGIDLAPLGVNPNVDVNPGSGPHKTTRCSPAQPRRPESPPSWGRFIALPAQATTSSCFQT